MQPFTISKEKGGKHDRNPYLLSFVLRKPHTETSSLRTFKMMPKKLKETFMNSASNRTAYASSLQFEIPNKCELIVTGEPPMAMKTILKTTF
jgi:hypothetical protein